jgi:hypothetical protein
VSEVRVRLRVGSLGLDLPGGMTPGQTRRLVAEVEAELTRRIEAGGLPQPVAGGGRLDTVRVQAPRPGPGPARATARLAEQVAAAVYEGLAR